MAKQWYIITRSRDASWKVHRFFKRHYDAEQAWLNNKMRGTIVACLPSEIDTVLQRMDAATPSN